MKKMLLLTAVAAAVAVAVAAAKKRPIEQPEQPSGQWELTPERPTS